ncbi:MAG: Na/Pi cotransporter family protein [Elusimicrobia bacterium]|nr:Na/Pi cotransporter family protein [Elusimicrobiota bacterium]
MAWDKILCFVGGGLGLFMYGMALASEAFQKVAGRRLRILLELLTANRFLGVGAGIFVTVCTQSSSATTVLLVSLANSGLIVLSQSLGVILGADIGTTVTIQIIAFKVMDYGLLMVALGAALQLMSRYERPKNLGQVLMGFGFLFYGISLMQEGMAPLQQSVWFKEQLLLFGAHPMRALLVSALFTALVHSSAATIAVALALASQGLLGSTPESSLTASVPIILGANIGTCATALLSSVGTNTEARRIALAHLLFKVAGAAVFFPLIGPFSRLIFQASTALTPDVGPARLLANAHTVFNLAITVLFIGFTGAFARMIARLVPHRADKDLQRLGLLPLAIAESAEPALRSAETALERMASFMLEMFKDSARVLKKYDARLLEDVRRKDEKLDFMQRRISEYLVALMRREDLGEKGERRCRMLFIAASNLEKIGNLISRSLMDAAYVKLAKDIEFSIEGHKEFEEMLSMQEALLAELLEALGLDPARAENVRSLRKKILAQKLALESAHIRRLRKGLRDSSESSWCFLEMINILDSISYRAMSVVHAVQGTDLAENY